MTKDAPFINTLGMKFVPVPITGGPTDGQRVLFSIWETRVQDYEVFAKGTGREWPRTDFLQGPTHPAVKASWGDAQAFCAWLTEKERKAGKLSAGARYRLPTDHEWSFAAGIGEKKDVGMAPAVLGKQFSDAFHWGTAWPPPTRAGNYAGEELKAAPAAGTYKNPKVIEGYRDGFVETAPVGSFQANQFGLHDLGGNAWEWCEDWYDEKKTERVQRGASWLNADPSQSLLATRGKMTADTRNPNVGFRCVLELPKQP
ncbi:MAG: SUMF1/EgtB/PvdO family nonheme iron enzyme [Prosthecobacter sp.]|nr:SUMF1/EgtB/PvdO family nonheme iron enzyme [Prosthecobacter sp.]